MGIQVIFNHLFGVPAKTEPRGGVFAKLSFMDDVRRAAARKTTDPMTLEERLQAVSQAAADRQIFADHIKNDL